MKYQEVIFETRICPKALKPEDAKHETHLAFRPENSEDPDDWKVCVFKDGKPWIFRSTDQTADGQNPWSSEWANIYHYHCVYFGNKEIGFRRRQDRILEVKGVVVDLDSHSEKDMSLEEIRNIVLSDEFEKNVPYYAIVMTGNGYQIHFACGVRFEPDDPQRKEKLKRLKTYVRALNRHFSERWKLNPDGACTDANRNNRLSDTWNTKTVKSYDDAGARKKVEVVRKKTREPKKVKEFFDRIVLEHPEPQPRKKTQTKTKNRPPDEAEVADALEHIDPSAVEYQDWLNVGMALHAWNEDAGLDVWDTWSGKDGERYDAHELDYKWTTFSEGGGITIGTVFHMAKENGWQPKPKIREEKASWNFVNYFEVDYYNEEGKLVSYKKGRPWREVTERLLSLSQERILSCQGILYARPDVAGMDMVDASDSTKYFAWLGSLYEDGTLDWSNKVNGAISEAKAFQNVLREAPKYNAVEQAPHYPEMPGSFYNHLPLPAPDYPALKALLARFNPETKADAAFILSMMMTAVWGGKPGQRPAFVITSPHGKGVGKSTLAYKMAYLLGQSPIDGNTKENMEVFKTRLLSPEGMKKRIAVFDNETGRVDSEGLAQMITGRVISGRKLYEGEGQRPNNLLWLVTLNTTHLSGDLAARSIPIHLVKPAEYNSADARAVWEKETDELIEGHRMGILAALIALLKKETPPQDIGIRWAVWASDVLAKIPDKWGGSYKDLENIIASRQEEFDSDKDEVQLIEDGFYSYVDEKVPNADVGLYFISNADAATIYQEATGSNCRKNTALRELKNLLRLGKLNIEVKQVARPSARGFLWTVDKNRSSNLTRLDQATHPVQSSKEADKGDEQGGKTKDGTLWDKA